MTPSFAWIDNSTDDRRRVLEAIEQLHESDSRDELGLSAIRDGFANALFPGTGTLQTRAAYFMFVPWMYRELHRKKATGREVGVLARKEEMKLIRALLASNDTAGVIGKVAQEKLKRLPSSVYWNGLHTWKILEADLTVEEYHRQFEHFRENADAVRDVDGELVNRRGSADWSATLPSAPADFPKSASFTLREKDRAYLIERVIFAAGDSLLAWLLRFAKSSAGAAAWHHEAFAEFPKHVQAQLRHAQCFSDTMLGAALLYNLMLAEALEPGTRRDELSERYRARLTSWSDELGPRAEELTRWTMQSFWAFTQPLMKASGSTMSFVGAWTDLKAWLGSDGLANGARGRELIRIREKQLKGPRARLANPRALELWGGESGTERLTYRWRSAIRILNDLRPELANADA